MNTIAETVQRLDLEPPRTTAIRSNLYALIEAISDEAEPGEEGLVTAVVLGLFSSGRIQFLRSQLAFGS